VNILYLTNNPNLGSTARTLQDWLLLGREDGIIGAVVAQRSGDFSNWLNSNGIPYEIDRMPWPDWKWPIPSLMHAIKVAFWARQWKIDIIHCNEHNVYSFGVLLRSLLRKPLVCHVRFSVSPEFCQWAFKGQNRKPDMLLWTSEQQKSDCKQAISGLVPEEQQQIVPLGLNLDTFGKAVQSRSESRQKWGVCEDDIVIGTASALRPIKHIEDFVKIVIEIAKKDPRVIGVIAGDVILGAEDYKNKILNQIQNSGLGNRLRWLGNLEPIEPFMHAIDIFISTSEYETFGMSVCEAMACRRPVAAYRGGSVHEVVGEAGIIVETGDLSSLIRGIQKLIYNPKLREDLGTHARERVRENFNPAKSFQQLKQIYESLLSKESYKLHKPFLGAQKVESFYRAS